MWRESEIRFRKGLTDSLGGGGLPRMNIKRSWALESKGERESERERERERESVRE